MRVGVCMCACGCVGGGDMVYGRGSEGGQDENSDYTCASYILKVLWHIEQLKNPWIPFCVSFRNKFYVPDLCCFFQISYFIHNM